MKKLSTFIIALLFPMMGMAQGWPAEYKGVMLQAFYWDSFDDTNWTVLERQADELAQYFNLIWLPQSGDCGGISMGYDDLYWFPGHYNSSFGTESELRSLISTFKDAGIGTIADVVINHRKSNNGWFGFPSETYKGVTYSMGPADVCGNDDGGKAKAEADRLGVTLGNNDTGEGWDGMRDLDHKSANVQKVVKAYLKMLLEDFGYVGFRYDMVKGYSASFTGEYNADAKPQYSVGEYWDGNRTSVQNWINNTKVDGAIQSAAFDFPFRYTVRDAINNNDWTKLGNESLASNTASRRYSVTFVENHDTEKRQNAAQDPIKRDTLAANAFMLAMPGTPCVFLKHWMDCKNDIKSMIDVRNAVGIHNQSNYTKSTSDRNYFAISTTGTEGRLLCVVGKQAGTYTPTNQSYVKVLSGYHYCYYMSKDMETAWADLASGEYETAQKVMLTAVSTDANAKIVYTTDGSNPTASSKSVASGTTIDLPMGTEITLKVGLLSGGSVKNVITREYVVKESEEPVVTIPDFCTRTADEVCAFFEAPATWTQTVKCWAWNNTPAENFTSASGTWPGADCKQIGRADNGNKVWKWTWDGTREKNTTVKEPAFIIFSNNGAPQTADLTFTNGGYYTIDGFFDVVEAGTSGIVNVHSTAANAQNVIYDLSGRRVTNSNLKAGIYIVNGRKVVIK